MISFSVPTGNFGDVFAGYIAKKMGLPIDKLIVATNENDILHRAISKGDYVSKGVKAAQFILIYNIVKTLKTGKPAGHNPWQACSLEWLTPTVPPEHGNWGDRLPTVHRWAYDYSVPGAKEDFITQTTPPSEVAGSKVEKT